MPMIGGKKMTRTPNQRILFHDPETRGARELATHFKEELGETMPSVLLSGLAIQLPLEGVVAWMRTVRRASHLLAALTAALVMIATWRFAVDHEISNQSVALTPIHIFLVIFPTTTRAT